MASSDRNGSSHEDDPVPTSFTADPLVGLRPTFLGAAAGRLARRVLGRPATLARTGIRLTGRLAKIAAGGTEATPEPGDRRFSDDAWEDNPLYRRLGQGYLTTREEVYRLIRDVEMDDKSEQRAEFALGIAIETLSPTNSLLNPEVLRKARETGGSSLVSGAKNFVDDVRHNGGMPSMVDRKPFSVGENVAVTPGRVVFRNDVLELLQYEPSTDQVRERPMVFVPPQINKYYILDIGPGKSMVEYLVGEGHQVFAVSWRNPTADKREWDLDRYVQALLDAVEAAREITDSDDVNITGACAGGITVASLLGYLTAVESSLVHAVTFLVTVLDMAGETAVSPFVNDETRAAAIRRSQKDGILKGSDLAKVFAWLRPNDLVCNYWVNNWLLGNKPPAFDLLAWNADVTNLPANLHADFLAMSKENPFVHPGTLKVLGEPVDLTTFTGDTFVVAGVNDHITPWESCRRTIDLVGGEAEFVLSASGHIQALVNPPTREKSRYRLNPDGDRALDADHWLEGAEEHQGSWWLHWAEWLSTRSGDQVDAPDEVGSASNPPTDLAPGRYVHNL